MLPYLIGRLLQLAPHALLVITLTFVLFRLVPGDPALMEQQGPIRRS